MPPKSDDDDEVLKALNAQIAITDKAIASISAQVDALLKAFTNLGLLLPAVLRPRSRAAKPAAKKKPVKAVRKRKGKGEP